MFGKNPVRKQELSPLGNLRVKKVFQTIQGEGPEAGRPAVFVRLWGCNLQCWFCDTDFEGDHMACTPGDLKKAVEEECRSPDKLIVLTGGEPLRQNIVPFCELMLREGWDIQIETAGTLWVDGLEHLFGATRDGQLSMVCSPKTPTLNMKAWQYATAWKYLCNAHETKFSPAGIPQMLDRSGRYQALASPRALTPVYLQPVEMSSGHYEPMETSSLNEFIQSETVAACIRYGHRLSVQTHKFLGLE